MPHQILKIIFHFCIVVAAIAVCAPALAADVDSQTWTSVTAIKSLSPDVDATLEFHDRFTEDSSTTGQRLFRPSVTYKINPNLSLTAGYFYGIFNTSRTPSFHEQRAWQQIGYTFLRRDDGLVLGGRTRLEERFVEDRAETGWRLRQQLRFESPFIPDTHIKGVVWNETFIGLNDTSWGQRSAFDQSRTFVGANIRLAEGVTLEPGYLNQVIFREGTDRLNHIASINLFVRF